MSVSWGTQYAKLKTNLSLAANRLNLLQKKKTEMAMKARTEITNFLTSDKEDRARIRVESIIREDFVVEAYEILEMYCELLLARFGLIQQVKELDDGIAEAVTSLLWVAPRISHEVSEFKVINDQLQQKYGKTFAEAARMNQLPEPSRVNPKLMQKLSVSAPSKILVEKYLIEIARCAGINFTPDPKVMRDDDDEIANAERNLNNFINEEHIGWNVPPPNIPPPKGPDDDFGSNYGGGGGGIAVSSNSYPTQPPPQYAAPTPPTTTNSQMYPKTNIPTQPPASLPSYTDTQYSSTNSQFPPHTASSVLPPQAAVYHPSGSEEHIYEAPPINDDFLSKFPEPPTDLPSVGNTGDVSRNKPGVGGKSDNDELDFDELARRFNELKKKY